MKWLTIGLNQLKLFFPEYKNVAKIQMCFSVVYGCSYHHSSKRRVHQFKHLDVNNYYSCYDKLNFYDGSTDQHPPIDYGQCSNSGPDLQLRSTGNQLLVVFTSQGYGSRTGFLISYQAIECPPFMYGLESCNATCKCNQTNTDFCKSWTGQCVCNANWTSLDCNKIADRCPWWACYSRNAVCKNFLGGFDCVCNTGYVMNDNGYCENYCQDPNFCPDPYGTCVSLHGGNHTCECQTGLIKNNQSQCEDCDAWTFGENCQHGCSCNWDRAESCDMKNGRCHCRTGWTASGCSQDVDECTTLNETCLTDRDHTMCNNLPGSFECLCVNGYEPVNTTYCDECGKTLTAQSGNIVSGWHGEVLQSSIFSECNWTITAHEGYVITFKTPNYNFYGRCNSGHLEVFDGNDTTSKLIVSRWGYAWDWDDPRTLFRTTENTMFIIRYPSNCGGNFGYSSHGFELSYWTHECQPFTYDETCSTPCNCQVNKTLRCDNITGACYCKPGWTGHDCSLDVDECTRSNFPCPDYSQCINLPGTFECSCKEGLTLNSSQLCSYDINSSSCSKNCSHLCVRYTPVNESLPVEQCYCPIGMELDGDQCVACKHFTFGPDCVFISECDPVHTARYDSFDDSLCECFSNWTGKHCEQDFDECSYRTFTCHPHSYCVNTFGGYNCECNGYIGYVQTSEDVCEYINCHYLFTNETGTVVDYFHDKGFIHEHANCSWLIRVKTDYVISLRFKSFWFNWYCDNFIDIFDGGSESSRTIGRYCNYPNAEGLIRSHGNFMFIKLITGNTAFWGNFYATYTAHACRSFTYGIETCDKNCRCVKENTQFCNNVNGECVCKTGWTSGDCSVDVNECLGTNNQVCPPNSDCVNTKGGYRCDCHLGFKLNSTTRTCQENNDCKRCSDACYFPSLGVEQCACPDVLVLDDATSSVCVAPYYPYGKSNGDSLLSDSYIDQGSVFSSHPVRFRSGAPFGTQYQSSAFVLSSGVVGFGDNSFLLGQSRELSSYSHLNLIAPYMANINPKYGQVYYHLYERYGALFGDSMYTSGGIAKLDEIISRARKDVTSYHKLLDFDVNTVLVSTWVNVQPFSTNQEKPELNTFQAVYISGWEIVNKGLKIKSREETAYVIFIYQYGKMNWSFMPGRTVSIGTTKLSLNVLKDLVTLLDDKPGNTGLRGVYSYKVGAVSQGPVQTCNSYVTSYSILLQDASYWHDIDQLYRCPCSMDKLGAQWELCDIRGDVYCFAIVRLAKLRLLNGNSRNRLCCYRRPQDWSGDWLSLQKVTTYIPPSLDSGHILFNDPWDGNSYAVETMYMHGLCCGIEYLCQRFQLIFPSENCTNSVYVIPRRAFGDPHITTLDGVTYAMNGWGEFFLLHISKVNFTIQARTDRAENR
ncbi:hypothetical protein Btru_057396 [Bulinus truncatus]|nr:hypothetical protein Btru_057396 [Bulinus truncatus]